MTRNMARVITSLKYLALVVFVLLIIVITTLYVALSSTRISQLLLEKISESVAALELGYQSGNLKAGLQLDLQYQTDTLSIHSDGLFIRADLNCLWRTAVCIDTLELDELTIRYTTQEDDAAPEPIELPVISSPITIELQQLRVKHLSVMGNDQPVYDAKKIHAALNLQASRVNLETLTLGDEYCQWQADGNIRLRQDYPLSMAVVCRDNNFVAEANAKLSGDLQALQLAVEARINTESLPLEFTTQQLVMNIDARINVLEPSLPLDATINTAEPVDLQLDATTVRINAFTATAEGPALQPSLELRSEFENNYLPGAHDLHARAQVEPAQIKLHELEWRWQEGELHVDGVLNYADTLAWQANARWQDFAILLQPDSVNNIQGSLSVNGSYQSDNQGSDTEARVINSVVLHDASAEFRDSVFNAQAALATNNSDVAIERLTIVDNADNRLALSGDIRQSALDLQLNAAVPTLSSLLPDASGSIEGEFFVKGPLAQPAVSGQAKAQQLAYLDYKINRSEFAIDWDSQPGRNNSITANIEQLRLPSGEQSQINLVWNGTINDHRMGLFWQGLADHDDKSLTVQCDGSFPQSATSSGNANAINYGRWIGVCDTINLAYQWQEAERWRLDKSIEIDWQIAEQALSVSTFCLRNINSAGAVCSNEFIQWRNNNILDLNILGEQLPLAWLSPLAPENLNIAGTWRFVLTGSELLTRPDLSMSLSAPGAQLQWVTKDTATSQVVFEELMANWHWAGAEHRIGWEARTTQSGTVKGHLNLQNKNLDGEFVINDLLLERFARLVLPSTNDKLLGRVNLGISVTGNIDAPVFNGDLSIQEAFVETTQLPSPLENINLAVNIDDNVAKIDGSFTSQNKPGELGGEIRWAVDDWSGRLTLAASNLVFRPQPKIELEVSPDLQLSFDESMLMLTGEVVVPRARIEISELPEQAITESSDAVVLGAERTDQQQRLQSEIKVRLGKDVLFKGFGLETNIAGALTIATSPMEPMRANGTLRLEKGRYKAYGQNLIIREGDLIFVNNIEDPQLRVEAVRDRTSDNVTVGLRAVGSASDPKITLFSNPNMSRQEQQSYLLTGNAPGQGAELDASQAAAEAALSYALESDVSNSLTQQAGSLLGVDDLKVTTIASDNGTQVGLSGYLTQDLMVSYGIGVFDAVNYLTLNYRLTKNIYLEMISGESSAFDILWNFEID